MAAGVPPRTTFLSVIPWVLPLIVFLAIFIAREPFVSLFINEKVAEYHSLVDGRNEGFVTRALSPGDEASLKIPFSKKSIAGKYALSDVRFIPDDDPLVPWRGEDKPRDWTDPVTGDMEDVELVVSFPIPEDPLLAGRTITGTLKMKVTYPKETAPSAGLITRRYSNHYSLESKRISCSVFSPEQKQLLIDAEGEMGMIWGLGLLISGTALGIFLSGFMGQRARRLAYVPLVVNAVGLGIGAMFLSGRFLDYLGGGGASDTVNPLFLIPVLGVVVGVVWGSWRLLRLIVSRAFDCRIEMK